MKQSEYVPVDMQSVMPAANRTSGPDEGYEIQGLYVNYSTTEGFTNKGFTAILRIPNNPFSLYSVNYGIPFTTEEDFRTFLNANQGNFNKVFAFWGNDELSGTNIEIRTKMLTQAADTVFGWTSDTGGCIGENI